MPPEDTETQAIEVATTDAAGTATDAAAPPDERAALIAAVDAAKGEEDKTAPAKAKAKAADPAAPADAGESKVAAVLRAREQAQVARDDASRAKEEAATARAEIAAMRAEAERDRAAAKTEIERLAKLKTAPLAAIKELGWDTKQLVDEVTREGTPEWQAQKRMESQTEAIRAELAELKTWREEQKKAGEQYQQQAQAQAKRDVESRFLSGIAKESPLRVLYDEAEIVAKGHAIADAYREKSGGQVATMDDLRVYLEEQAAKRLAVIRQEQGGATGSKASAAASSATQSKASPRALSGAAASERRASPKPRHEWTPDEEYSELKAAAEAAMGRS